MPVSFPRLGLGRIAYPTHRYRITASYWNTTGRAIPEGGMAKVAGILAPTEALPAVDVRDPLYQDDLRYVLGLRCNGPGGSSLLARTTPHGS